MHVCNIIIKRKIGREHMTNKRCCIIYRNKEFDIGHAYTFRKRRHTPINMGNLKKHTKKHDCQQIDENKTMISIAVDFVHGSMNTHYSLSTRRSSMLSFYNFKFCALNFLISNLELLSIFSS